jgi:hypothetical protein
VLETASATNVIYEMDEETGRLERAIYDEDGDGSDEDDSYVVYSYDANGNRTKAEFFSSVDITPPSAPGTVSFPSITVSTARVEWLAATDNVDVTNYAWSRNGGLSWNSVGNQLFADLTGLSEATQYTVWIRASDALGNTGPNAFASFTTTDVSPPGAPGTPTFTLHTATSVVANWAPATDNLRVTSYEWSRDAGASWTSVGDETTASITGLSPVTSYTIRVRARDAANHAGPFSFASFTTNNVPDTEAPSPPGIPQFSETTATSARASWAAATDNVNVAGYQWSLDGSPWSAPITTRFLDLSGLTGSTTYTFRVRAVDGAGLEGDHRSNTFRTLDVTPPGPPGIPEFPTITGTSVTATWATASDDTGVAGYEYSRNGTSYLPAGTAPPFVITGLTQDTQYTIYIRAFDLAENRGAPSSATVRTRDTQRPTVPGVPEISLLTGTSVTVSWDPAGDNVGVDRYQYSLNNWVSNVDLGLLRSVSFTGLTDLTPYTVYVRALDAAGNIGDPVSVSFTTLDATPPGPPGIPTFSLPGSSSVTVSWTLATDNATVSSYEYSTNSGGSWTNVGNALSANVTGLSGGTTYPVWVRARDSSNLAGPRSESSFTTFANITVGYREVLNTTGFPVSRAEFRLTPAGDIEVSASSGFAIVDVGDWLSPKVGMSGFQVRITNASSQLCELTPALNTWTALSSSAVFRTAASGTNPPASTCAVNYQIRHSSSPNVILGTGETYLRADH